MTTSKIQHKKVVLTLSLCMWTYAQDRKCSQNSPLYSFREHLFLFSMHLRLLFQECSWLFCCCFFSSCFPKLEVQINVVLWLWGVRPAAWADTLLKQIPAFKYIYCSTIWCTSVGFCKYTTSAYTMLFAALRSPVPRFWKKTSTTLSCCPSRPKARGETSLFINKRDF